MHKKFEASEFRAFHCGGTSVLGNEFWWLMPFEIFGFVWTVSVFLGLGLKSTIRYSVSCLLSDFEAENFGGHR